MSPPPPPATWTMPWKETTRTVSARVRFQPGAQIVMKARQRRLEKH